MRDFFLKIVHQWKVLLKDRTYRLSFIGGIVVFTIGFAINKSASIFTDSSSYVSVGDLLLDTIPTYNLEFLFIWGIYTFIVTLIGYAIIKKPETFPFVLKCFGILFMARGGFITLTQIGPPIDSYYATGKLL